VTHRRLPQRAIVLVAAAALALGGLAVPAVAGAPRQSSGRAVTVQAGTNVRRDPSIVVTEFLPSSVTVLVDSTVTWSWTGAVEPHSVTFFAPGQTIPPPGSDPALFLPTLPTGPYDGSTFVNSGLQPLGSDPASPFSMTFSQPGKYAYHCVIHPNMVGTVNVVRPGASIDSAASVTARGKKELARWTAEGVVAKEKLTARSTSTKNRDGTTTYDIDMGTTTAHTDVLAFSPTPRRIKAGDRVRFVNNSGAPHTATFSPPNQGISDPLDPRTDTQIPGPSPQTLTTGALFNTGELPPELVGPGATPPPETARSYVYTVPVSGKYVYYCILHTTSGMGGVINAG
jgi:plastocyanin